MKIMLIQTPWSKATAAEFDRFQTKFVFYPPMGLMCLAASVEKDGHTANIIDLEVEPLGLEQLHRRITQFKVDIIGITSSTPIFYIAKAYAKALKERLGLPVVIGGPHITALKDRSFTQEFDFAVTNEGEHTLVELMDALQGNKNYSTINGLIYRQEKQIKVNYPRAFIEDLDSLPFPARHKLDPYKYTFEVPRKGLVTVTSIALTRGCPFHCVFCSEPLNAGRKLRARSVKNVLSEILEVKEKFKIDHFYMLDSNLTINRKLIEDFCYELINRKADITFEGQTRADLIDEPLLNLMKEAGLVRLSFGLESSNRNVLNLMKKQIEPESIREAFRLCKKLKIFTICGAMMGNPGDTRETIINTARFIRSIPEIRYAPLPIAVPYPGTELFHMAQNDMHGLKLLDNDYKKYNRYDTVNLK